MSSDIILGITGGIAAYKSAALASSLTQEDLNVYTVMTSAAREFISPLTFRSITQNPVEYDMFAPPEQYNIKHTSLAKRADLIVVAPATADFIARVASGMGDDLLSTVIMATKAPILLAPAMNVNMYRSDALQKNLEVLRENGFNIISPEKGRLACGDSGEGRMPEPEQILNRILRELTANDLSGRKFLITAGPTREALDKVRYFSNYSTGKMGYSLAERALARGGEVILVSGPTHYTPPRGCSFFEVETAEDMKEVCLEHFPRSDIAILAAAVADFKPAEVQEKKIKKGGRENLKLNLVANPDIMSKLVSRRKNHQLIAGFAAESDSLLEKGKEKLKQKGADLFFANDITGEDSGFASSQNAGYVITGEKIVPLSLRSKEAVADVILEELKNLT